MGAVLLFLVAGLFAGGTYSMYSNDFPKWVTMGMALVAVMAAIAGVFWLQ